MIGINPPNDYGIPEPQLMKEPTPSSFDAYRKTQLFLNVKNWKCPECGAVVFGRVLECVICKFMFHRITPRPAHYTKKGGA